MRTIYRWETNGLYMEDRPSVFSLQTVCFSFIRVVCIFCIALSASEMPIFVRFFLFFPATGRKYGILVMHKKQSVKMKLLSR